MLRKCIMGCQFHDRTSRKTLCALIITTLSAFIVMIRTFGVLTVVQDVKYTVDMDASSHKGYRTLKTIRSSLLYKYETHFSSNYASSSKDTNFTAVILLTYMRSGSSFTGEILQQNDNVFYVFEPLRMLNHLIKTGKPVQWMNGTSSTVSTLNITDVKMQTLIGWLTCNFSMVYAQSFDDWYFFTFGKKTIVYKNCIINKFGIKLKNGFHNSASNNTITHIRIPAYRRGLDEKCLQDLQNACLSSKVRIIKTIRTPMDLADGILTKVNNGKIIHLIRDPRETIISQAKYRSCPGGTSSVASCSNSHCRKVLDDTVVKQNLLTEKPGRVHTVLYEHISSYPSTMTKLMYSFVGMEYSEKIDSYVTSLAQDGNVTGCNICEQSWQARDHSNNSATRGNFLTKMNPTLMLYIQNICRNVILQYGYKIYEPSMLLHNT